MSCLHGTSGAAQDVMCLLKWFDLKHMYYFGNKFLKIKQEKKSKLRTRWGDPGPSHWEEALCGDSQLLVGRSRHQRPKDRPAVVIINVSDMSASVFQSDVKTASCSFMH